MERMLRIFVSAAAVLLLAGLLLPSTTLVVAGTILTLTVIVGWFVENRPHNHWRNYRRRRSNEP